MRIRSSGQEMGEGRWFPRLQRGVRVGLIEQEPWVKAWLGWRISWGPRAGASWHIRKTRRSARPEQSEDRRVSGQWGREWWGMTDPAWPCGVLWGFCLLFLVWRFWANEWHGLTYNLQESLWLLKTDCRNR